MIAVPVFGYKSHISIDRKFGFIRESAVTAASAADGRMLKRLVTTGNTSSEVWADSAYRSRKNEKWLAGKMLTSRIHRRKPAGKPMPQATARANARKSAIRAAVERDQELVAVRPQPVEQPVEGGEAGAGGEKPVESG